VQESHFDELCGLRQIAVSRAVDWFCFVCRGYISRNEVERWVGSDLEGNGCEPVNGAEPESSWAEEAPEEPAMGVGKLTDI
jgi:hypothetical protein